MGGTVYFGTKERMVWIPAPKVSMPRTLETWTTSNKFLGGGASVRRSGTGARTYELDWSLAKGTDIGEIYAYADRAHGDGPFYLVDPDAANYNLFPQYQAHPYLGVVDAPVLYGTTVRPTSITTPSNTQAYPIRSAVYTVAGTGSNFIWFPVPSGYTLHIGAHGSATGSGVITAVTDAAVATNLTLLGNNTTTRTNYTYAGPGGVSVRLGGTGTVTLSGLIAQLRPTGQAVPIGGWIPGKGNSGCDFASYPGDDLYNSALDFTHTSAILQEVGAWL